MTSPSLRQRLLNGDPVFGTFIFGTSPFLVEVVARSGVDWVLIDLEHGTADESDLLPLLLAAEASRPGAAGSNPVTSLVRVKTGERIRVGRALDLGAGGIMVPQVHTAEQARRVAAWMRTQPGGERGIALYTRGMDFGLPGHDGVASRHDELLCIVQIESTSAVAEADAIAGVDGVDVLFVGPSDLTHALGIPGRLDHPDFLAAVERVGDVCAAAGKAAGIIVRHAEEVSRYLPMGYRFFAISTEANILDRALRLELETAFRAVAAQPPTEVP